MVDFEKDVIGEKPELVKLFSKGGAWGLMAFFVGLAFYTFFLVPTATQNAVIAEERKVFVATALENNAHLQELADQNAQSQADSAKACVDIAEIMRDVRTTVEAQQAVFASINNELHDLARDRKLFEERVMADHPELLEKVNELLGEPDPE